MALYARVSGADQKADLEPQLSRLSRIAESNRNSESEVRIRKAEKQIARLEKTQPGSRKLHQKRRRLVGLFERLKAIKDDQAGGRVRLCFGSRKLSRAQLALMKANGYEANGYKAVYGKTYEQATVIICSLSVLGIPPKSAGDLSMVMGTVPGLCRAKGAGMEHPAVWEQLRISRALGRF